jgi:hypothetical protein
MKRPCLNSLTLRRGRCEFDHVVRQDLWHTSDLGADDKHPSRSGFYDTDSECLRQRRRKVDLSSVEYLR